MLKKILAILISCLIVMSFGGCKKADTKSTSTITPKTSSISSKSTDSKNSLATSGSNTQNPTTTSSATTGVVSEYSIDLDFQVKNLAAGIIFGYIDESNFLMWQVNTNDFGEDPLKEIPEADRKVYLRPHVWVAGAVTVINQIDVSNAIKWADKNKTHHMKITVSAANEINTYINDILVDTCSDDMAAYGMFGFRQTSGGYGDEAYYDNILITNTANKQVLKQYDFNADVNPFTEGEIVKGVMGDTSALYMSMLSADIIVIQ